jgi:hypothetical protein
MAYPTLNKLLQLCGPFARKDATVRSNIFPFSSHTISFLQQNGSDTRRNSQLTPLEESFNICFLQQQQ